MVPDMFCALSELEKISNPKNDSIDKKNAQFIFTVVKINVKYIHKLFVELKVFPVYLRTLSLILS